MQTFLPYPSFVESARVLDRARLGKQRVEALQVLRAVTIPTYGWRNHPVAKMWRGYVPALTKYALVVTDVWIEQGHADTVRPQVLLFAPEVDALPQDALELPPWINNEAFHLSHRSNLVRKDPEFYGKLFPGVPDDLPYLWPGETRAGAHAVDLGELRHDSSRRGAPSDPTPGAPSDLGPTAPGDQGRG